MTDDDEIELTIVGDEYVTLLDCIKHAKENAVTSTGRVEIDKLQKSIMRQYDRQF